jgi:hypothetical protein
MTMRFVVKISLAALLLACLAVSVQAAQLFPLQTGQWMEFDKIDNQGHTWTVRMMVFEAKTMDNGKQYFRAQELYYDPYGIEPETFGEFYLRSTETEIYFYNPAVLPDKEILVFLKGEVGDYWDHQEEDNEGHLYTVRKEILSTNDLIPLPYGGTYAAYKYRQYNLDDLANYPTPTRYDLEWVAPGLGYVQEEDHWFDSTQSGRISYSALARAGSNPLFFPLKTGMRLTYDASDQQNHTWKMRLYVGEQVTLDGLSYFRMRQTDYDPIGGDRNKEFYARCDASKMYVRKLDENLAHLEYQAAGPETEWHYSRTPYTIYKKITAIQPVNVLGGSYLAYVTNQSPDPTFPLTALMSEFIVPGLGPVEMLDWWVAESDRAPLQFLLTGISQGGAGPAVDLLLME